MPYIKLEDRAHYDDEIGNLAATAMSSPGHINYVISKFLHQCLPSQPKYADLNAMIGVLECAKLELFRKVVAPYEDDRHAENGPVSNLDDD